MRAVVTGFEPFGDDTYNPSEAAVRALAGRGCEGIVTAILPVEFEAADAELRELIRRHRPELVLCCGLNASLEAPVLERIAHNERSARIPDNSGAQPQGEDVVPGGPELRRSTMDVEGVVGTLTSEGWNIGTSDDAGRYVCNSTLYVALDELGGSGRAAFLHIPNDTGPRAARDADLVFAILEASQRIAGS